MRKIAHEWCFITNCGNLVTHGLITACSNCEHIRERIGCQKHCERLQQAYAKDVVLCPGCHDAVMVLTLVDWLI